MGDPISGSFNEPYPSGYAPIPAALDLLAIDADDAAKCGYYRTNRAMGNEHDIIPGDVVWTMRSAEQHDQKDRMRGVTRVRTSLTNLCHIPSTAASLKDFERLSDDGHPDIDTFVQDLVSSHLHILGVAYGDAKYRSNSRDVTGAFSVKVAGVAQVHVHDYMPIGCLAQAIPPHRREFKSQTWKRKPGQDPGKITLKVVPVTPDDLGDFMLRIMHRYIFKTVPSHVDPTIGMSSDGRTMATYQAAKAMATFAKVAGVLFLNTLLRYNVVTPIYGAGFRVILNKERDRNFSDNNAPYQQMRRQHPGVPAERRRHNIGYTLGMTPEGRFIDTDGEYPASAALLPEEVSVVVAKGVGLFGPVTHPVSGGENRTGKRGELIAANLASSANLAEERRDFEQLEREFLSAMFLAERKDLQSRHDRSFEFGHMDYAVLGNQDAHAGRARVQHSGFMKGVNRRMLTGQLLGTQLCALFDVMRGVQNVYNVQRARVLGRVIKTGPAGGMCDVYINTAT